MAIELNRLTFKRLVQSYLLSLVLTVGAVIYEVVEPTYASFSTEFDILRANYFGEISESQLYFVFALCLVGFAAHVSASFGLLGFKRWARWMFWGSALLGIPSGLVPSIYPYWSSYWSSWTIFIGSALFGMILLLAYSRGHGAIWFTGEAITLKEENNG